MHDHNDKNNSSMMWMMLPCLIILVFAVLFGGGGFRSWPYLALIGIMVAGHLWMMFRGHGSHGDEHTDHKNVAEAGKAEFTAPENKGQEVNH